MIERCSHCGKIYCWGDCYEPTQGIEAGTVETERLDAKHESPVRQDAPEPSTQTHTTKKKGE